MRQPTHNNTAQLPQKLLDELGASGILANSASSSMLTRLRRKWRHWWFQKAESSSSAQRAEEGGEGTEKIKGSPFERKKTQSPLAAASG